MTKVLEALKHAEQRLNQLPHNYEETDFKLIREAIEEAVENKVSLQGANLREANLWRANLREANLQKANLRGANLEGANITKVQLADIVKGIGLAVSKK